MAKENLEKVIMGEMYDRESRRVSNDEYLINQSFTNFSIPKQAVNYPDARKHQIVSFIKSGIRILGYVFIPFNLVVSAILLILSEIVGIIEELV